MNKYRRIQYLAVLIATIFAGMPVFAGGAAEQEVFEEETTLVDGQEVVARTDFTRPRRMVFFFDAPVDKFSEYDRLIVYNSILTEIFDSNPEVVVLEASQTTVPPTVEGRQQLAREADADAWVLVRMLGSVDEVSFYEETYDMLTTETFGSQTRETGLRLDYRALSRGFWSNLRSTITANFKGLKDVLKVTLHALPGTRIFGIQTPDIEVPDSGVVELELQNPATYSYRAVLDGYYPTVNDFYLGYENVDLDIPQIPAVLGGGEVGINSLQFPSLQGYLFLVPGDLYIRAGFTTYALGVYLLNDSLYFFRSNPLSIVQLDVGFYILNRESFFRPYFALGGNLRIEHSDFRFGVDENTPFAASLIIGGEYALTRSLRVFVEYNPLAYFPQNVDEFRASSFPERYIQPDGSVPGYVFVDGAVFDFRNFIAGVRLFF